MSEFLVVDASRRHCGIISRRLRAEHRRAVVALGFEPHKGLVECFETSAFRRTWMIDGELAGLGGITGSLLSAEGMVWLALTELATRYPVQMVKEARRQLEQVGMTKRSLVTSLLENDEAAERFARFLGFVPDVQVPRHLNVGRRWMVLDLTRDKSSYPEMRRAA